MSKSNIKILVFSIVIALVIIGMMGGGTYAFLQWSTNSSQRTYIDNVTIIGNEITMHIEPENTDFSGLRPTKIDSSDDCSKTVYGDTLVTIINKTGTVAIPSFKLKVRVTKSENVNTALTPEALSHINYVVIPLTTTVSGGKPVKGGTGSYNCSNSMSGKDETSTITLFSNVTAASKSWSTHLNFGGVSTTTGEWSHIPSCTDTTKVSSSWVTLNGTNCGYLPRQYYLETGTYGADGSINGITFKAPPRKTTYQYFRIYAWLDETYSTTTVGTTVTDPLQNAKIEITWSDQSFIQQAES